MQRHGRERSSIFVGLEWVDWWYNLEIRGGCDILAASWARFKCIWVVHGCIISRRLVLSSRSAEWRGMDWIVLSASYLLSSRKTLCVIWMNIIWSEVNSRSTNECLKPRIRFSFIEEPECKHWILELVQFHLDMEFSGHVLSGARDHCLINTNGVIGFRLRSWVHIP